MANEKEDVLQANAGAPGANIPDLKKKNKERKRAGAAWSGARGAAGEFSGATGGTVSRAAASAASAAIEGGAADAVALGAEGIEGGGLWATIGRFFEGLTSTLLGKIAVGAAAFLMAAAAGILGYRLLKGGNNSSLGSPNLGGITDSMKIHEGGSDRMGVDSRGELRFDPLNAAKTAAPPPVAVAKAAAPAKAPPAKLDADAKKPVPEMHLAHNLSGAQLSSSLGGDFGNKNIFSGNSGAPKFATNTGNLPAMGGVKGKMGNMLASTLHATPSARNVGQGSANKAFGQLRLAKGLSMQGANATTAEQAASAAQGAFDQQQPTGGNLATTGAPGGDTVAPPDPGAPDTTIPGAPSTPTGTSTDSGLQSSLQQISDLAKQGASDIQTGTTEEMIGAILVALGIVLECCPISWGWGAALMAVGLGLIAMGVMKVSQGKQEVAQAEQMGQTLANNIQDQQQGAAVDYCTQWQVANPNSPMSDCNPPDSVTNATDESAQDAADVNQVKQIPVGSAVITQ